MRGCKWVDEVVEGVPYVMSDEYLRYVIEKYRCEVWCWLWHRTAVESIVMCSFLGGLPLLRSVVVG